jgi:membrane protein implicated in regulation of membrane protease activity
MSVLEQIFLTCALSGTVVFTIRMILMFIGLTGDGGDSVLPEAGAEHAGDIDFDSGHGDLTTTDSDIHHDIDNSDASFRILSIQGLTAFFMMFGWVGLAMIRESGMSGFISVFGALVAGLFSAWVLACMFRFAMKLQSDGTMRISSAMGAGGTVYLRIPAEGTGQVQVEVDGRLKVFDATSANKEEIKTGEQITVVWIQDNGILAVEKDERETGGRLICGR